MLGLFVDIWTNFSERRNVERFYLQCIAVRDLQLR